MNLILNNINFSEDDFSELIVRTQDVCLGNPNNKPQAINFQYPNRNVSLEIKWEESAQRVFEQFDLAWKELANL